MAINYELSINLIESSFNLIKNYTYNTLNKSLGKIKRHIIDLKDRKETNKDIKKAIKQPQKDTWTP